MSKEDITEIQKALTEDKLVIGTDVVIKKLKNGEVEKVFITANAPEIIKSDIEHYAKMGNIDIIQLDETNEELKEICKKRFNISIVALSR